MPTACSARCSWPVPACDALLTGDLAAAGARPAAAFKVAQNDWYNPESPWLKLHVNEDGLYRINRAWLADFVDPTTIDPRSLRLFNLGAERPLHVVGEADATFDDNDYLLFHGRYRRDDDQPLIVVVPARRQRVVVARRFSVAVALAAILGGLVTENALLRAFVEGFY